MPGDPPGAHPVLGVLPSLSGIRRKNGRVVLAGRFLSGLRAFRERWPGRVVAIVEPEDESGLEANLDRTLGGDNVEVTPGELDFELVLCRYDDPEPFGAALRRADLILAGIHYRQNHVAAVAKKLGRPVVYTSEYTLKTRLQIVAATAPNLAVRARRVAWEVDQERRIRHALSISTGLQANGTPTFEAYRDLTPNPLLFFDGRGSEALLIPPDALEARLRGLGQRDKLRLAFAGRMNKMKGADQLLEVARHLRDLHAPFTLDIYGGGVLADEIATTIERESLGPDVRFHGYVPFDELMPHLRAHMDLFLCCHVQGDPSGMYLEMLGLGLPFVGYANEALAGILRRTNVGQAAPVHDAESVARIIARLARDRGEVAFWSRAAVAFARSHTFEKTFARRAAHLERCLAAQVAESRASI